MTAIGTLKVTQGHQFLVPIESPYVLSYLRMLLTCRPISHRFRAIAVRWSNYRLTAVPLFNSLVLGKPLNSRLRNFL